MNTDIKTLMQMNIGQINDFEEARKRAYDEMGDLIDRQKETVASCIEQEDIDEDWANNFLEEMKINDN